jgi:hypothetical protein
MIRRDPPAPPPLNDLPERLVRSHQMKVWLRRLLDTPPDQIVDTSDIDPILLGVLTEELMKRRDIDVSTTKLRKAMRKLTPILSVPQFTDVVGDTRALLSLPQMQAFWQDWTLYRNTGGRSGSHGERGPNAMARGVKAVLLTMASPGSTSLLNHAHGITERTAGLQDVYRDLMWTLYGEDGDPQFSVPAYRGAVAKHWKKLLQKSRKAAIKANIEIIKQLRELDQSTLRPGERSRVGRGLLVDGTMIVAWAQQWAPARSLTDEERERMEEALRKYAPDATFCAYSQRSDGSKIEIEEDANLAGSVRRNTSKSWRGFLLCALVDQATGLPIIWTLIRNREYEGIALLTMLAELHELWPELDADWIAGDGLYDDDDLARICAQNYGINPIFRHNSRNSHRLGAAADGKPYDSLNKLGQPICRRHRKPMQYGEYTLPRRDGMRPGHATDVADFDVRMACVTDERANGGSGPCGTRIRVDPSGDWSRIVKYPHHNTHAERHAFRRAAEQRLNGIESAWAALKAAHGLGVAGAHRPRVRDMPVYEGLISLAFLQRAALTLWDQLDRRGRTPVPLTRRPVQAEVLTGGVPIVIDPRTGRAMQSPAAGPLVTVASAVDQPRKHPLASGRRGRGRSLTRGRQK